MKKISMTKKAALCAVIIGGILAAACASASHTTTGAVGEIPLTAGRYFEIAEPDSEEKGKVPSGHWVIKEYTGKSKEIGIPGKIKGHTIGGIRSMVFAGEGLTAVSIPNSVTYIGSSAFAKNQLSSVTIPDSVTYIGTNAFRLNQITSGTIPESVTTLGIDVFGDFIPIIPESVRLITNGENDFAFKIRGNGNARTLAVGNYDSKLKKITIPDSVYGIPVTTIEATFGSKKDLSDVYQYVTFVLPAGLTEIEAGAFRLCKIDNVITPNQAVADVWNKSYRQIKEEADIARKDQEKRDEERLRALEGQLESLKAIGHQLEEQKRK
jgi:hypothetical protein